MFKEMVKVNDWICLTIRCAGRNTTTLTGEVVGVRADYSDPDRKAIKIYGIDFWVELTDEVNLVILHG